MTKKTTTKSKRTLKITFQGVKQILIFIVGCGALLYSNAAIGIGCLIWSEIIALRIDANQKEN
jgi:hypothetical protein